MQAVVIVLLCVSLAHAFSSSPACAALARGRPAMLSLQQQQQRHKSLRRGCISAARGGVLQLRAAEMSLAVSDIPPEEDPLADIPAVKMHDDDGICMSFQKAHYLPSWCILAAGMCARMQPLRTLRPPVPCGRFSF